MATIYLHDQAMQTVGNLPEVGSSAPNFTLANQQLANISLADFAGQNIILNIFPSVDTGTCAASVREFNTRAAALENTQVICVSADLPFAFSRFCGAEGIENVQGASTFRSSFGEDYGVAVAEGGMQGLMSRAVVVINAAGSVVHAEQVENLVNEPNYDAALAALA